MLPEWADPAVPEDALDPQGVSRRGLLAAAGLLGGLAVVGEAAPAEAHGRHDPTLAWLVGDHHVHSVYSHDAKYTFSQQAMRAAQFGLDWMVFTEHSNFGHANAGGALAEHADVLKARAENPRLLIFQGLEWYIPAAEHATVFTAPGPNEADVLRQFELAYDGKLLARTTDTAANQQLSVDAITWLADRKRAGDVPDVLVLANHPSRLGIDSPGEMRRWRDADPSIVIGMEGAPGAQGAALPGWGGANAIRGEYQNQPSAQSWPGYPAEAYLTHGGFDWMTATVGGMWDALLSEGRLFSITTNSDNHRTVHDTWRNGDWQPGQNFDSTGKLPDPVDTGAPQPGSDFWPGQFSRTHVGVTGYGHRELMAGLRAGRVWVDHGQLLDGVDVRLIGDGGERTLGGRLRARRGERLTLQVTITTSSRPNFHGELPRPAHVDVIRGAVRGPAKDPTSWRAPATRVVRSVDVRGRTGTYTLRIPLDPIREPTYIRLRGSDGRRNGPGLLGPDVDPRGPIPHTPGDGDPWLDTWFYTNPIFIDLG